VPVILWMGVLFFFSSIPGQEVPSLFPYEDIFYHFAAYFILGLLFSRALKKSPAQVPAVKIIVFTAIFGIIYGLTDEFHQSFVPNRSACASDLVIDGIAAFSASFIKAWSK